MVRILLALFLLLGCTFQDRSPDSNDKINCSKLLAQLGGGDAVRASAGEYFSFAVMEKGEMVEYEGHVIDSRGLLSIQIRTEDGYKKIHRRDIVNNLSYRIPEREEVLRIERLDTFRGRQYAVEEVIGVPMRGGMIPISQVAPDYNVDTDFVVGITLDGVHSYLNIGNMRLDGNIFKRAKINRHTSLSSSGILLHYKGNDPDTIQGVTEYLARHHRQGKVKSSLFTRSCYDGVCQALKKGGEIALPGKKTFLATEIFNDMLTSGFVKNADEAFDMKIYVVNSKTSLQDSYKGARGFQYYAIGIWGFNVVIWVMNQIND